MAGAFRQAEQATGTPVAAGRRLGKVGHTPALHACGLAPPIRALAVFRRQDRARRRLAPAAVSRLERGRRLQRCDLAAAVALADGWPRLLSAQRLAEPPHPPAPARYL